MEKKIYDMMGWDSVNWEQLKAAGEISRDSLFFKQKGQKSRWIIDVFAEISLTMHKNGYFIERQQNKDYGVSKQFWTWPSKYQIAAADSFLFLIVIRACWKSPIVQESAWNRREY